MAAIWRVKSWSSSHRGSTSTDEYRRIPPGRFKPAQAIMSHTLILPGARRLPMRQTRYAGQVKVHLQEVITATALNCLRLYAYVHGVPRGLTWVSHLARLKRRREQEHAAA